MLRSKLLIVEMHDVLLDILIDHIQDDLILRVQYDVSKLSEVLNDVLGLEVTFDFHSVVDFEVGVFEELLDQRVNNAVELIALLG